jgi:hypothetical protein
MSNQTTRTGLLLALLLAAIAPRPLVAGLRKVDPATVVPIDRLPLNYRDQVAEVIRDHTLHRRGNPDAFPCNRYIYLCLLNEPALTLALWQDLGESPAKLQQIAPDVYRGTDGAGASASWEYVLRTPQLHVLFSNLEYVSPRTGAKLHGRLVLLVRATYFQQDHEPMVRHEVEAYVKIDSVGWKAVAATVRPMIEHALEEQLEEAGWFVSLMGRLVENYPNWAVRVAVQNAGVRSDVKTNFRDLVVQFRKPTASPGRPEMVANDSAVSRR